MMTINDWITRYYPTDQIPAVMAILSEYGTEAWHREAERVKRDAVIISKGSIESLRSTMKVALWDYRDVLIGEEIDPWVIEEINKSKNANPEAGDPI